MTHEDGRKQTAKCQLSLLSSLKIIMKNDKQNLEQRDIIHLKAPLFNTFSPPPWRNILKQCIKVYYMCACFVILAS